jgi:CheY-like chemotaxis protein
MMAALSLPSIVYVDDNAKDRQMFRTDIAPHLLNPVYYLSSAEDFLHRLSDNAPDRIADPGLIFVELVLPGMSGFELVHRIRHERKHLDLTPLIVVTGIWDEASIAKATEAGADYYIGKPMTVYTLNAALKELNAQLGQFGLAIVRRERTELTTF